MSISYANRGMGLEQLLEFTNETYLRRGMAVVHKRATPIHIKKVHGSKVEGFFDKASTVDYDGVYSGRSLQFEAKSTREVNKFPLDNFHEHQIEHMRSCLNQGAIVFVIVEFAKYDERLCVPARLILHAWDEWKKGGQASISRSQLLEEAPLVPATRGVPVDYLSVVDKWLSKRGSSKLRAAK